MVAHLACDGRQRFQVRKEIEHVLAPGVLIGRVRKGRKIMLSVGRDSVHHRVDEFGLAPFADAIGRIGRDVRRIERSERRLDRDAAAKPETIGLVGDGMA
ncbi:hypothetical protein ACVWXL_004530 [Bradyrhizobium sp. GM22.5]